MDLNDSQFGRYFVEDVSLKDNPYRKQGKLSDGHIPYANVGELCHAVSIVMNLRTGKVRFIQDSEFAEMGEIERSDNKSLKLETDEVEIVLSVDVSNLPIDLRTAEDVEFFLKYNLIPPQTPLIKGWSLDIYQPDAKFHDYIRSYRIQDQFENFKKCYSTSDEYFQTFYSDNKNNIIIDIPHCDIVPKPPELEPNHDMDGIDCEYFPPRADIITLLDESQFLVCLTECTENEYAFEKNYLIDGIYKVQSKVEGKYNIGEKVK